MQAVPAVQAFPAGMAAGMDPDADTDIDGHPESRTSTSSLTLELLDPPGRDASGGPTRHRFAAAGAPTRASCGGCRRSSPLHMNPSAPSRPIVRICHCDELTVPDWNAIPQRCNGIWDFGSAAHARWSRRSAAASASPDPVDLSGHRGAEHVADHGPIESMHAGTRRQPAHGHNPPALDTAQPPRPRPTQTKPSQ